MAISHLYTSSATTYRQDFVGISTVKKAYVEYLTGIPCHLQPFDPAIGQTMEGGFGKNWVMFCPVADYKEGDKVIINAGNEYRITGVETFNLGLNPHAEVTIRDFRE